LSAKNVTVYMPAETVEKMQMGQFKETNWSKIAREAIENYINDRTQVSIPADLLLKLQVEMNTEYSNGRKFAVEVIGKALTYSKLANFFEEAQRLADVAAAKFADHEGMDINDLTYTCDSEAKSILRKYFDIVPREVSSRYIDGVYSFLKEIWERLNPQSK
jgi:hypothetical protein